MGLSLGCVDGSTHANQYLWYTTLTKWINIILSSQKMQEKNILQNSTLFHDKTLNKLGIDRMYLNTTSWIINATAHLILSGGSLKTFSLNSETRQWRPLSPLLFNIVHKILPRTTRQPKKIKMRHTNWKGRSIIFCL